MGRGPGIKGISIIGLIITGLIVVTVLRYQHARPLSIRDARPQLSEDGLREIKTHSQELSSADSARPHQTDRVGAATVEPVSQADRQSRLDTFAASTKKILTDKTAPVRVTAVVNADGKRTPAERYKAIQALRGMKLNSVEVEAYKGYLLTAEPASGMEFDLKDQVLVQLTRQLPASEMITLLEGIYVDHGQALKMRDFALQHLSPVYAKAEAEDQQRIAALLQTALGETDTQIAGTALLMMHRIVAASATQPNNGGDSTGGAIDAASIEDAAMRLVQDSQCSVQSRVTAMQVAADRRITALVPLAVSLAEHAESVPLQVASIAALPDLGGANQQPLLMQLASSPEQRVKVAATAALKRVQIQSKT